MAAHALTALRPVVQSHPRRAAGSLGLPGRAGGPIQRSHLTKTGGSPGTDGRKAQQDRRAVMVSWIALNGVDLLLKTRL